MTSLQRRALLATRLAVTALIVGSVAACAGVPDVLQGLDGSAGARELNVPWQPLPMRPTAAIVAAADQACRKDIQFQADLPLLLVDARGEGRLQLYYGAPTGESGECNGIFVAPDGTVRAGGGGAFGSAGAWPPIADTELMVMSSSSGGGPLGGNEQHVVGRAGPAIQRVQLRVAGLADPIEATVANGWWSAWWPGAGACQGVAALASDGSVLGSLPACQ